MEHDKTHKMSATWVAGRAAAAAMALALPSALALSLGGPATAAQAQKVVQRIRVPRNSKLIGQTHADHGVDHDTIIVKGPYDNSAKSISRSAMRP